jgi:hypothetical protein
MEAYRLTARFEAQSSRFIAPCRLFFTFYMRELRWDWLRSRSDCSPLVAITRLNRAPGVSAVPRLPCGFLHMSGAQARVGESHAHRYARSEAQ